MSSVISRIGMLLIGLSLAIAWSPLPVAAKTYQFTYSNFFPPSHVQSQLADEWCREVEKRTQGRVKIAYYPGGTLTSAAQSYDGVVTQRSDIALSSMGYSRGRFPLMASIMLPSGIPNGPFATAVYNEINDKFSPEELSDTQILYLFAHGPGLLHTRTKLIDNLDDLKGLKIRGAGAVADIIKALGASPVTMPMPELYQALQKGVAEGAFYPEEVSKGWKMAEVVDYTIANYQIGYSYGFCVAMNKEKWQQLPADLQEIIREISLEWTIKHGKAWDSSDYEGIRYSLQKGNTMIGIPTEEAKRWKEAVRPVYKRYIEKCEDLGLPGQEVFDYLMQSIKQYKNGKFESKYLDE
ncbi:MAG: TRAP transporter substrate-binding protein [Desulfohalobiaceae bacterium]|nr:TRAP transporter substrate-binding protein [Desulfohalobiaceae bacterium]